MENAVDALKMAAAALVFIIAIGTSFSIFGTAKTTADSVITMRDKQAYLESAESDNGILYTSSDAIKGDDSSDLTANAANGIAVTKYGDRIVEIDDVISTIYRYSIEKYGVTVVNKDGKVLRRFDSYTESIMATYSNTNKFDGYFKNYEEKLNKNTETKYSKPKFEGELKNLYDITINGGNRTFGAPWYGNEEEVQKRIACELTGIKYEYNGHSFTRDNLISKLEGACRIIEVTNEIDNSKYLEEGSEKTELLQQYEIPTIEIIYILE